MPVPTTTPVPVIDEDAPLQGVGPGGLTLSSPDFAPGGTMPRQRDLPGRPVPGAGVDRPAPPGHRTGPGRAGCRRRGCRPVGRHRHPTGHDPGAPRGAPRRLGRAAQQRRRRRLLRPLPTGRLRSPHRVHPLRPRPAAARRGRRRRPRWSRPSRPPPTARPASSAAPRRPSPRTAEPIPSSRRRCLLPLPGDREPGLAGGRDRFDADGVDPGPRRSLSRPGEEGLDRGLLPSASRTTRPSSRFAAEPATPRRSASWRAVSRYQTPCTRPDTTARRRTVTGSRRAGGTGPAAVPIGPRSRRPPRGNPRPPRRVPEADEEPPVVLGCRCLAEVHGEVDRGHARGARPRSRRSPATQPSAIWTKVWTSIGSGSTMRIQPPVTASPNRLEGLRADGVTGLDLVPDRDGERRCGPGPRSPPAAGPSGIGAYVVTRRPPATAPPTPGPRPAVGRPGAGGRTPCSSFGPCVRRRPRPRPGHPRAGAGSAPSPNVAPARGRPAPS